MQLLDNNLPHIEITNDIGDTIFHVLEEDMINAVNAALAINRPLLIWGEPGIGKSQLAKAVAKQLKRPFLHFVADAKTEARDLLWQFDAVARLAEAQILKDASNREALAVKNFIIPGVLWWALNWESAKKRAIACKRQEPNNKECDINNGAVVLIDEIDKADSDVPNGLLEALGAHRFQPQGLDEVVECTGEKPLVIITTNEERALPDAFVRRCLSLHLHFPKSDADQIVFLVKRAQSNAKFYPRLNDSIFQKAAEDLVTDRQFAESNHLSPLPGQAEYFDVLRGLQRLSEKTKTTDKALEEYLEQLRKYTYRKHTGFHRK